MLPPAKAAGKNGVMDMHIEGDLLYVEVAVVQEYPLVVDDKRKKDDGSHRQRGQKDPCGPCLGCGARQKNSPFLQNPSSLSIVYHLSEKETPCNDRIDN